MMGKKDIWSNHLDVFASIAFYLKSHGWDNTKTWGRQVLVPKEILNSYKESYSNEETLKFWSDIGVKNIDGKQLPYLNLNANLGTGYIHFIVALEMIFGSNNDILLKLSLIHI